MNMASTSLLFEGDSAGDPPVTKHLFIATIPTWPSRFLDANRPVGVFFKIDLYRKGFLSNSCILLYKAIMFLLPAAVKLKPFSSSNALAKSSTFFQPGTPLESAQSSVSCTED